MHQYKVFDEPGYPYSFEYPINGRIYKDSVFSEDKLDNRYWININIEGLGGIINITYKKITPEQPLYKLQEDSWGLSFFHHEKADYIDHVDVLGDDPHTSRVLYTVGGNSASRYQFTATDSVKHFVRGALYFDVTPNADSLQPATDFLATDIIHLLRTLKWKE